MAIGISYLEKNEGQQFRVHIYLQINIAHYELINTIQGHSMKYFVFIVVIIISTFIINQTIAQCLYPAWETTCQKYCLENKHYRIQTNQCWSKDPKNLRCQCNDHDFTEVIKRMFITNKDLNDDQNNLS
ncbi:hypothetical protein I4U23_010117 [Adineta vaga]|nr:hypothetical protein I4U23_010117 [Adineta vaga]